MLDSNTRVLVLGARGLLGSELCAALEDFCELTAWDIEELDITDRQAVLSAVNELAPSELVNCAAFTDVDGAESQEEQAMSVNALAPGFLGEACRLAGARLTHISTEYVFDGTAERSYSEEDSPNPLSIYGRSKLAGELEVVSSGCRHAIIRSQWLYGERGRNFVDTIIRMAEKRDVLKVVNDQMGRPTWVRDLAAGLRDFLHHDGEGIYHLAAGGECSWFDVAVEIEKALNRNIRVDPVPTSAFPRPAPRPLRAVLDCGLIKKRFGIELRHWKAALREYLQHFSAC